MEGILKSISVISFLQMKKQRHSLLYSVFEFFLKLVDKAEKSIIGLLSYL